MTRTRTAPTLAALAVTLALPASAQTAEEISAMSRDAFVDHYMEVYEDQLDWTQTAFDRVGDGFADYIDTDSPISDAERAVPGCLYDAADTPEAKEQLGLQLANAKRIGERLREDSSLDYVDVAFGGIEGDTDGFEPTQDLATMMQDCRVPQTTMQRMSMTQEAWTTLQNEGIERGYIAP